MINVDESLRAVEARLNDLRNGKKKLVLWGAGKRLNEFISDYCNSGLLPAPFAICDSTRSLNQSDFEYQVITMSQLKNIYAGDVQIVITAGLMELQGQIVSQELYYHDIVHRLSFDYYFYICKERPDFSEVLGVFSDEMSKHIFAKRTSQILEGGLFNSNIYSYPPYFGNEIVQTLDRRPVVFAGAFNGKHIDNMLLHAPNLRINAFEPSPSWCEKLKTKYKQIPNVTVDNILLWDEESELFFDEDFINGGLDARVIESPVSGNEIRIPADSIDNLLSSEVGSIILDVEGSEQKVISGFKKTVETNLPNLSICIYHTADDFFRIPIILQEAFGTNYKFYLRQHSPITRIETVMYGVPNLL